ncbi:GNAT family N-acetyltransferase [Candidatus Uabimicrobium amorphum]|uniref:Transcriptional regulator n=1 Tax=Uabimicrobium amorphum TaxID=2596890 RepID=A0A5S9F1B7_UABAM|nr:GNAT family N-acetyltransferase [Candidatus Uabimicrobium amorphum]BBM81933.1 transcriptional regulator [Candidatus Uabimicrobium amorphum]
MYEVRKAQDSDVVGIKELFICTYGEKYPYHQFFDLWSLKKMCFDDDYAFIVCVEKETQRVVGSASVVMNIGAYADLVGEFGRLIVHPDARKQGLAQLLMEGRLQAIKDRLHVAIVDARTAHPYSQKVAEKNNFRVVGFLPQYLSILDQHESVSLLVQYFGNALSLRKHNPCIVPEVYHIAATAMRNVGIDFDAVIDEKTQAYPYKDTYTTEELTTTGYSHLLRIQRGRLKNREVFGSMRLHYGFFKLNAKNAHYIIAKENGNIVGAIGYSVDDIGKAAKVFELISIDDQCIYFLIQQMQKKCKEIGMRHIEIDVSGYSPRIQRTLLELQFLPAGYIPAFAFHDVERYDVIKMINILDSFEQNPYCTTEKGQEMADIVFKEFIKQNSYNKIHDCMKQVKLFESLNSEQLQRISLISSIRFFEDQQTIFNQGDTSQELYIIVQGEVEISQNDKKIATVHNCECLGEMSLVDSTSHSAAATAKQQVKTLVILHQDIKELMRVRSDIAALLYKNLARSLSAKLRRNNL